MSRSRFVWPGYDPGSFPEYAGRQGQIVNVIASVDPPSDELETVYWIRFPDGFEGQAFESELVLLDDSHTN